MASKAHRGFTLIEIILSLALTAMLLTLLSAGMFGVMNDWDDDSSVLEASLDETVAILQLERALQGAFPHSYRNEESLGRFVYFEGETESLRFVSTVSPQRSGGLMAWQLESHPDEGVTLQLAAAMSDNPNTRLEQAAPRLLLPHYTAEFHYLYEELDFTKQWRDEWMGESQLTLPLAVHVRLSPRDENQRNQGELDIIARIRATEHPAIRPVFGAANPTPLSGGATFLGAP